ncbi:MAG: hypothetical protein EOM19_04120 [Candidatus Moranbacteria bacterium]|nr:hypothetical protein [Candidatus Moranbacteria bacterium]
MLELMGGGDIFKIQTDGTNFGVLHSFDPSASDGDYALGSLIIENSVLYGMTSGGGADGEGNIFSIEINGTNFTSLYDFSEMEYPEGSLVFDEGVLYGVTPFGGNSTVGTLFKIDSDGSNFSLLWEFFPVTTGNFPYDSLLVDGDFLYGMTWMGGGSGPTAFSGGIFRMNTDGTNFTLLHGFSGGTADGEFPLGSLIQDDTTLYGMTSEGGLHNEGIIFKIQKDGSGFTLLHSFTSSSDGGNPQGSLVLEGDTLFGLASEGGSYDAGTIFKIETDGTDFEVFHNFNPSVDGERPQGSLILNKGVLYGGAEGGVTYGTGILFKIETDGSNFSLFHELNPSEEGVFLADSLLLHNGVFYGMTMYAGANNGGAIFKMQMDGTGIEVLHDFDPNVTGRDPRGSLIAYNETLYGMTSYGGTYDTGTIFKIQTDGTGIEVLHHLNTSSEGGIPFGSLSLGGITLYGMVSDGGEGNNGSVFSFLLPDTEAPVFAPFPTTDSMGVIGSVVDHSDISFVEYQEGTTDGSWSACVSTDESFDEKEEDFRCLLTGFPEGTYTIYLRASDVVGNVTPEGEEIHVLFVVPGEEEGEEEVVEEDEVIREEDEEGVQGEPFILEEKISVKAKNLEGDDKTYRLKESRELKFTTQKMKFFGETNMTGGKISMIDTKDDNKVLFTESIRDDGSWSRKYDFNDDGRYKVRFRYYDASGKIIYSTKIYRIAIDTKPPVFVDFQYEQQKQGGESVSWLAKDENGVDRYTYTFLKQKQKTKKGNFTLPQIEDGSYILTLRAYDTFGNASEEEMNILVKNNDDVIIFPPQEEEIIEIENDGDTVLEEEYFQEEDEQEYTPSVPAFIEKEKNEQFTFNGGEKILFGIMLAGILTTIMLSFAPTASPLFSTRSLDKTFFGGAFLASLHPSALPFYRRKKQKYWGTVFDDFTKSPLENVVVSLVNERDRIVETVLTDKEGRYGFLVLEGTFTLRAQKEGYRMEIQKEQDTLYGNVYHGEVLQTQERPMVDMNITLVNEDTHWEDAVRNTLKRYMSLSAILKRSLFYFLSFFGFTVSFIATLIETNAFNVVVLVLYFFFFFWNLLRRKSFGTIKSGEDNSLVPFAIIELYKKGSDQRVKFVVSDILGRYYLLVKKGSYSMKVRGATLAGKSFEASQEVELKEGLLREDIIV